MKTNQLKLVLLVAFLFTALATVEAKPVKKTETFSVGMHCESCKQKVERNLAYEKGVLDLVIDLKKNRVKVTYDTAKTNVEKIKKAFKKLGFEAELLQDE
jgi:copper chaperone CopZ